MLVPNERGLGRARAAGAQEIAVFESATESFAKRNLNRDMAGALAMFAPVVERARAAGKPVRGYVSMCFGDPWEGDVEPRQTAAVARRLLDMGCGQALANLYAALTAGVTSSTVRPEASEARTRGAPRATWPLRAWCGC